MAKKDKLLTPTQAASKLGITKELLFAYTRYPPKKSLKHDRRLSFQSQGDQRGFRVKDLEAWSQYLWEPWSETGKDRPKIPSYIVDYLKVECGGQCALCGKGHPLENAHIEPYETSLSHHHHNLIRLCKDCHAKFDDGIISKQEIQDLKNDLIEKLRNELLASTEFFPRSVVYQPPQPNPLFVGREAAIQTLRDKLFSERFVIIEGVGGIGKTQLLLQILNTFDDIETVWLDVESYERLEDLEVALIIALSQGELTGRAGLSAWHLLEERPLRLILDGIEHLVFKQSDEVTDFLVRLVELTQHSKIVVTSQVELSSIEINAYRFTLSSLSMEESIELVKIALQAVEEIVALSSNDSDWLIQFCDGHPLTLKLVVGLLGYYRKSEVVIKKLHEMGAEILKDPIRVKQKRSTSLNVCLKLAYETFSHPQKRLLQYISNFPGGFLVGQAEQWHETDDFEDILAGLRRFFFVEPRLDGLGMERLHLLHPIGEFVRAEWKHNAYEEAAEIQLDVAKRLMIQVLYLHFKYLHSEETAWGLARIDVDLPNYIHAMRYGLWGSKTRNAEGKDPTPYLEIIAGLSTGLSSYFFIRGMLKYKLSFAKFGAEAEEKLGKYESAADTYFGLATMQTRFHDYDGLQETTTKLVALSEKTSNLRIQALTSMALGEQARQDHDLALLISHYEQAVNYFRNALLQDRSKYNIGMLGNALSRLGRGYELTRKHQKALNIHLEALDYHKEINDNVNLGNVYHHLGNCYATLGDFAEAIQSYKQAIEFFVELGHAQYLSNALCEIGEVVVEAGLNSDLTQFLSYDLLVWGLEDLKREVELLLEKRYTAIYLQGWNGQLLRKIFAVIKLVSLSTETHILRNWAEQFGEETFLPLMESPDEEIALYLEQQRSFINYLRLILTIALVIGEIAESEESPTNEQLNELCNYCYQFGELGWGFFKPFEWLATWLHENGICPNVPTHKLHIAVEQSMWTGEPIKF